MWDRIVGQEPAVALLQRASSRPVHAYLLTGPPGSGVEDAARCFAAAMLCDAGGCGACDRCERALRGRHPDLLEFEPDGTQFRVGQAAEVTETAFRTPVEGARKIIVVLEADRMNERAQNKLLKTFEEPPGHTVFLLLTTAPDALLPTVRSRCQEVRFGALTVAAVRDALVADGLDEATADRAARLAGGRLDRARLVAGEYSELRRVFGATPGQLDGTGRSASTVAAGLLEAVEQAFAAVKARHEAERDELDAELEQVGYPDAVVTRLRRALAERHKRAEQRARQDALADGLTALEMAYRDALVGPELAIDDSGGVLAVSGRACLEAIDACSQARRLVQDGVVLNWGLLLEHLALRLPAPAGTVSADPLDDSSSR